MAYVNTCRCDDPQLFRDRLDHSVRCYLCGKPPRDDLGGDDHLARIRYRARLNRLTEEPPAREPAPKALTRSEARELRAQRARAMREEGKGPTEIAEILCVAVPTVYDYLNPEGYEASKERAPVRQADQRAQGNNTFDTWRKTPHGRRRWNAYQRERTAKRKATA